MFVITCLLFATEPKGFVETPYAEGETDGRFTARDASREGYPSAVCISDCRSRSEITERQERTAAELMPRGKCLDKSKDIYPVLCPARNRPSFGTT